MSAAARAPHVVPPLFPTMAVPSAIALQEAGVQTVQIDDPHLCPFVDKEIRAKYPDADAEAMHCVSLVDAVFEGVTGTKRAAAGDTRCLRAVPDSVNIGLGCVEAYAKLANMMRAAEILRAKHG